MIRASVRLPIACATSARGSIFAGPRKQPTIEYWLMTLAAADVPPEPYHTLETLMDAPQLAAVGLLVAETHDQVKSAPFARPFSMTGCQGLSAVPPARSGGTRVRC